MVVHRAVIKKHDMSKLFEPIRVETANLSHRVVLAPMTRFRVDDEWVPLPIREGYVTIFSYIMAARMLMG